MNPLSVHGSHLSSKFPAHSPQAAGSAAGIAAAAAAFTAAAQNPPARQVDDLITALKSTNDAVSSAACDSAPDYGPSAVRALAFTMAGTDLEVGRRAKRALYRLVRHAGRPGATSEAAALQSKLVGVLYSRTPLPVPARREVLWMISEIGTASTVAPVAELLTEKELREDARCVLIRLPFPEAVVALKTALTTAEENFKYALADALRARGEKVEGYPSKKMVPTAQTPVVPAQPKK